MEVGYKKGEASANQYSSARAVRRDCAGATRCGVLVELKGVALFVFGVVVDNDYGEASKIVLMSLSVCLSTLLVCED